MEGAPGIDGGGGGRISTSSNDADAGALSLPQVGAGSAGSLATSLGAGTTAQSTGPSTTRRHRHHHHQENQKWEQELEPEPEQERQSLPRRRASAPPARATGTPRDSGHQHMHSAADARGATDRLDHVDGGGDLGGDDNYASDVSDDGGDDDGLDVPSLFDSFTPSHKDFWHMAATMSADDGNTPYDFDDDAAASDDGGGSDDAGSRGAAHTAASPCSACECADGECACCRVSCRMVRRRLKTFGVIVLVGALSTGLAIGFRAVLRTIQDGTAGLMLHRNVSVRAPTGTAADGFSASATYFVLLPCFLLPLLASIAVTALVSPAAAGSGIPRMKAVFGGVYLPHFLSLPTLVAKVVGLLGSVASGLSVGSEGPFVHIACCIAAVLLRIPWFRYLNRNIVRRHGVLAMACVAGVVAAFGTPFGGLLFAVEVVATYFKISDLPQMFWAALVGVLLVWLANNELALLALFNSDFVLKRITYLSLLSSAALGVVCGALGGAFVLLIRRVGVVRRRWAAWFEGAITRRQQRLRQRQRQQVLQQQAQQQQQQKQQQHSPPPPPGHGLLASPPPPAATAAALSSSVPPPSYSAPAGGVAPASATSSLLLPEGVARRRQAAIAAVEAAAATPTDDCFARADRCCSGRLQRCCPRRACRPVAPGRVSLAVAWGVGVLLVQFTVNFSFAVFGFPWVFDQRQLIQDLFNTTLSSFGNYSPDNAYGYGPNSSCPAAGEPFEVLPSTFVPLPAAPSSPSDASFFSNGAVTLPLFLLFLASRFLLTPLALQVPLVPSGLFTPLFLLGALVGRAWGVLFACALQSAHLPAAAAAAVSVATAASTLLGDAAGVVGFGGAANSAAALNVSAAATAAAAAATNGGVGGAVADAAFSELSAAEYAILGAAAFAGATTRTISTVIIVMELTGSLYLQLPVAVCVLTAYFVADGISPSVYELMQSLDSLPVLPAVDDSLAHKRAIDVMEAVDGSSSDGSREAPPPNVVVPPLTVGQARRLLDATAGGEVQFLSVVESADSMLLVGEVQRLMLVNAVLDHEEHLKKRRAAATAAAATTAAAAATATAPHSHTHGGLDVALAEGGWVVDNALFGGGVVGSSDVSRSTSAGGIARRRARGPRRSKTLSALHDSLRTRWSLSSAAAASSATGRTSPTTGYGTAAGASAGVPSVSAWTAAAAAGVGADDDDHDDTPILLVAAELDSRQQLPRGCTMDEDAPAPGADGGGPDAGDAGKGSGGVATAGGRVAGGGGGGGGGAGNGCARRPYITKNELRWLLQRRRHQAHRHNQHRYGGDHDAGGGMEGRGVGPSPGVPAGSAAAAAVAAVAVVGTGPVLTVPVDLSALQVSWSTPLYRINILVHMLRMYHAHVVDHGRVVGFITRPRFIRFCARLKQAQFSRRRWRRRLEARHRQQRRRQQRRRQQLAAVGNNKRAGRAVTVPGGGGDAYNAKATTSAGDDDCTSNSDDLEGGGSGGWYDSLSDGAGGGSGDDADALSGPPSAPRLKPQTSARSLAAERTTAEKARLRKKQSRRRLLARQAVGYVDRNGAVAHQDSDRDLYQPRTSSRP